MRCPIPLRLRRGVLPAHQGLRCLTTSRIGAHQHGHKRGHTHQDAHSHGRGHTVSHGHGKASGNVHLMDCHDHSHANDLAEMKGEAMRVTLLGLGCNLFLGSVQLASGRYCHSAALTSDAWHTLTDSLADLITLGVVQLTLRPPGPKFPFGRGKLDSLAALGVSCIMVTTGVSTMRMSASLLSEAMGYEVLQESHGHGHSHGHSHGSESLLQDGHMNQVAVGACLLTVVSKEGLYHITRRAAERLNSSVLLANAWHHRSDALSSMLVLLGVLCRVFVHSAFDPIAGAFLSSVILRVSWGIGRRAVSELLDMQLPEQDAQILFEAVQEALRKVQPLLQVQRLKGRRAGPEVHLEALCLAGGEIVLSAQQLMQLEKTLLSELHLGGHKTVWSLRVML